MPLSKIFKNPLKILKVKMIKIVRPKLIKSNSCTISSKIPDRLYIQILEYCENVNLTPSALVRKLLYKFFQVDLNTNRE